MRGVEGSGDPPGARALAAIRANVLDPMLTARGDEVDRPIGLVVGAHDDVCQPFGPLEPIAWVRALLRCAADRLVSRREPLGVDDDGRRSVRRARPELDRSDRAVRSDPATTGRIRRDPTRRAD